MSFSDNINIYFKITGILAGEIDSKNYIYENNIFINSDSTNYNWRYYNLYFYFNY